MDIEDNGTNFQALAEFAEAIFPVGYWDMDAEQHRRPMDSGDDRAISVLQHKPM